jgi:hypothetical protein
MKNVTAKVYVLVSHKGWLQGATTDQLAARWRREEGIVPRLYDAGHI